MGFFFSRAGSVSIFIMERRGIEMVGAVPMKKISVQRIKEESPNGLFALCLQQRPVQAAVLDGLGDMGGRNGLDPFQIGDGAGDL